MNGLTPRANSVPCDGEPSSRLVEMLGVEAASTDAASEADGREAERRAERRDDRHPLRGDDRGGLVALVAGREPGTPAHAHVDAEQQQVGGGGEHEGRQLGARLDDEPRDEDRHQRGRGGERRHPQRLHEDVDDDRQHAHAERERERQRRHGDGGHRLLLDRALGAHEELAERRRTCPRWAR